ncbi:type 4a pilus biogenesis protein PilO [Patescibacteria group bacterium]|nr:type 4a pilus biogenesis protein PilO [Patescibacteria group bacterium]
MPTSRSRQLTTMLLQFYDRPIAKVSLELFFTISAVIIFAVFAIRPTLQTMGTLIKELEDKRALNQRLAQKVAALSTAQTQYEAVRERISLLDEAIPPTPQFEKALLIIEKLASESQLTIINLQAKEVPKEPDPAEDVPFEQKERATRSIVLTVTGDYPTIRQLIENIQAQRRVLIVDTVVFSVVEQRGKKVLQAAITVNVPFFAPDLTKPADPSPTPDDITP